MPSQWTSVYFDARSDQKQKLGRARMWGQCLWESARPRCTAFNYARSRSAELGGSVLLLSWRAIASCAVVR